MSWTLTRDLRQTLNSFGTLSLQRILGYCGLDFVSNERLLRETQMRFVTRIVCERQLRLYGHVARFPDADPAHQILSAREPCEWRRPMGRSCASWLQHVDQHLKEMGMARRRPGEWPDGGLWSTSGKSTQRRTSLAQTPIPDLTYYTTLSNMSH